MSQTLDYSTADVPARPRVRRLNLVAVPAIVALVIAFAFQGPALAMHWHFPRRVGNALFFLPQTSFPYRGLVWNNGSGSGLVLDGATAQVLGIIQWLVVVTALTYFLRRVRILFVVPLVLVVTVLIAVWGPLLFEPFGMYVQLDGP